MTRLPLLALALAGALAAAACDDAPAAPSGPLEGAWRLVSLEQAGGSEVTIEDPERFTVRFEPGGRLAVRADCNSCSGAYTANGTALDIGDAIACTRVFCGSAPFDTTFLNLLAAADQWTSDGAQLELSSRAGRLRFRR